MHVVFISGKKENESFLNVLHMLIIITIIIINAFLLNL